MSKRKRKDYGTNDSYDFRSNDTGHILGINFSDNPEQRELIRLMNEKSKPIIFCSGDAGTGKTFTAIAAAIDLVKVKHKYSKIFYLREPLEVGRSLGYLPGDISDKYNVYLGGLEDNLFNIAQMTGLNMNDMRACIETTPPQFVRGRSFPEGSLVIADETQNFSLETIQMLCTRMAKFSKIIFIGSLNQIDLKGKTKENNDFKLAMKILDEYLNPELDLIGRVELIKSERSEYCKLLDDAFNSYKQDLLTNK